MSAVAAPASEASSSVDLTGDYDDLSVTIDFALRFNAAKCAAWWLLWLIALAYAFIRRGTVSRAWFIYTILLATICFNGIQTSAYVAYADHVQQGHSGAIGYLIYIFFFNLSRCSFLAVLLVVASGYCITRSDLGPHKQHVIFVPTTVLVTGLITDYSFYALQSSPDSATYDLSSMGTVAATVWFVCSVLNLAALILAWMYIFEALGKETRTLEDDYKRRTGKGAEERHAAAVAGVQASAAMAGHPGYAALGSAPSAAPVPPSAPPPPDVEAGGDGETVAEHMQYTAKHKLLSRFGKGVAAYLISDICVLLLPAFFNDIVQSTLQALLFVCYFAFVVVLLVLFRPQEQSSYLMVGFSEEDAEARGVSQLATGIAMAELGPGHDSSDDEISRLGGGAAAGSSSAAVGSSNGGAGGVSGSSAAAARGAARAAKAAARAAKKAGADGDRYRALPAALPTSSSSSALGTAAADGGGGAGALPVSTGTAEASYGTGALPPPASYRGRQPRTFVPQQPASGPRQFTLGDEDDDDDASRPLTGPGKDR